MKRSDYRHALIVSAVAAVCGAGVGGTLAASAGEAGEGATVLIKDFHFSPMSVTVKAGSTVRWVNMDEEPHTVVSDSGLFRSNGLDTNEAFTYRFDRPGIYHIACSIHPRMEATIVVE